VTKRRSISSVDPVREKKQMLKASSEVKLLSKSAEMQISASRHDLEFT